MRPWKLPENTMTLGRPVACLASFTAGLGGLGARVGEEELVDAVGA